MIGWVVLSKTRVELMPAQFLIEASVPGSAGLYMLQSIAAGSKGFSDFADGIHDPADLIIA